MQSVKLQLKDSNGNSVLTSDNLEITDGFLTQAEQTAGEKVLSFAQLAEGKVSLKAGTISSSTRIQFTVVDDGSETIGTNESVSANTLTLYAELPASDDVTIINQIRVNQVIDILGETLTTQAEKDEYSNTINLAAALSDETRVEFLRQYDVGLFSAEGGAGAFKARRFIQANISTEGLEGDRSQLEQNISGLGLQSAIEKVDVNTNSIVLTLDASSWTGNTPISGTSTDGYQLTIDENGAWSLTISQPDWILTRRISNAEIENALNSMRPNWDQTQLRQR